MKRGSERDGSPTGKRSRSSVGSDRGSPDRDRRSRRSPRSSPPRVMPRYDYPDDYMRAPPETYKVLCVGGIHPKASDEGVRDALYREFKKFGDVSVKVVHAPDERFAYVYFRSYEDARDAMRSKPRILFYDKPAFVEPVVESSSDYRRRRTPSPEYDRYSRRSPPRYRLDDDRYAPAPEYSPYDYYGPPPRVLGYGPEDYYGAAFGRRRPRREKFPNYLHHIAPEDDPLATRTLFAGNLELNMSDEDLRRIFSRYGQVEDIDVKRPPPGTGNAYAFIRYENLDMAHRAKVELSGQYIGKFQCKIGYGKPNPSHRVWVGGLGAWTSLTQLEREFDRFGAIKKIDYAKGDPHAYVLYDSVDAAKAAVQEMRGFPLGGPDKRLRVDFADAGGPYKRGDFIPRDGYRGGPAPEEYHWDEGYDWGDYYGGGGGVDYRSGSRGGKYRKSGGSGYRGRDGYAEEDNRRRSERSPEGGDTRSRSRSPRSRRNSGDSNASDKSVRSGDIESARNINEIAKACGMSWHGGLILKNSLFPTKFYLTEGDTEIVESLLKDEDEKPILKISQRLRLDKSKLDDVNRRLASSPSFAIFLSLAGSASVADGSSEQQRPLRNLVSYLKQKDAAGVITLMNKKTEATGVLYAFPPCTFAGDLLKRSARGLLDDGLKDDHLVVVVVKGAAPAL